MGSLLALVPLVIGFAIAPAEGREAELIHGARGPRGATISLTDAALIASGVRDADLDRARASLDRALAPAIARATRKKGPMARGRELLRALHDTVLRSYVETATELDSVIDTGEFNCLSSALLYAIAAQKILPDAIGMMSTRHAFLRMRIDDKVVDIETTSAAGFLTDRSSAITAELIDRIARPGEDKAALGRDLRDPEEVPIGTLVAGVYANRSVLLIQRGALEDAATALDRATMLASGAAKQRFGMWRASILNNAATALVDEGRLDQAEDVLELALKQPSGSLDGLLRTNLARVHVRKAQRFAQREDWGAVLQETARAQALGIAPSEIGTLPGLAQGKMAAERLDDSACRGEPAQVAACEAQVSAALLNKGETRRALAVARRAETLAPRANAPRAATFLALQAEARAESESRRCDVVELLAREMKKRVDVLAEHDRRSWSEHEVIGVCWAGLGNDAFQASRWADAARAYATAKLHLPTEKRLDQNLARVELNRAIELARRQRCAEAGALVRRADRLDSTLAPSGATLLEGCASNAAKSAVDARDWGKAITALRRGLVDVPDGAILKTNLRRVLVAAAQDYAGTHRCDDARALVDDLVVAQETVAAAEVGRRCP